MSYVLPSYARAPISIVKGEGCHLYDSEGTRYIDLCAGIATASLGHAHPRIIEAISEQAATLMHCSNLYHIPQQEQLAELISTQFICAEGKVFFSNSGAESNDGIIKTARRFGHRRPAADGSIRYEVITFQQSFHGRTLGSLAATGQDKIKEEFNPLLPGFIHVEFNKIEALKAAITPQTCAIMLEAVQGEGGVNPVTPEFLRSVAELCQQHDLLLMLDEVQCGFARTGARMGWQSVCPEITPDVVSCAKGMGGGFPIGAFWISDRAIDEAGTALSSIMGPGSHGSTYGGNPLACATSLAVLHTILEDDLTARAAALGELIEREVLSWDLPQVECVRGKGLLRGIGLREGSLRGLPADKLPSVYLNGLCLEAGLLCCPAGPSTLRLIPALTISEEPLREGLSILRRVLSDLG